VTLFLHFRHALAIDLRFSYRDRTGRVDRVLLRHELRSRLPHELVRRPRTRVWEATAPRPDVDRLEYQFELIDKQGGSEFVTDPKNPLRASGPWGDKSVLELPGYEPPDWLGAEPLDPEGIEQVELPSRVLHARLPALFWAHPGADEDSPLLVVHDGPEYAEHSALLTLLAQLPPLRAALVGPVDRNETYSASARYARTLVEEILPALPPAPFRVGLGASLGALALLHAHRRHPDSFDGLFLQSGSFFRRRDVHEHSFPRFQRISRFVGSVLAGETPRPIPLAISCGTVEDNLRSNLVLAEALRAQGHDVDVHEFRDGHNWVAWRDDLHPRLSELIDRAIAR
jgi:enterochelin esterase family protein